MTLLIDVGNSAIKWARMTGDGTLGTARMQLHRGVAGVEAKLIENLRADTRVGAVIACSVAGPNVEDAVEGAVRALGLAPVRWLRPQSRFEGAIALWNDYRSPEQLGADRWHGMLGACALASAPATVRSFIVVNAGTATTVDCVEADDASRATTRFTGRFIGGVIAPGVRLMLDSLARQTAGLPPTAAQFPQAAVDFPQDTEAAIVTGVLDAQSGLVHQLWHRFAARLHCEPRLILTGGHAEALQARLPLAAEIEHNLVLRGLGLRAQSDQLA